MVHFESHPEAKLKLVCERSELVEGCRGVEVARVTKILASAVSGGGGVKRK